MEAEFKEFDPADYLDNDEVAAEYLQAASEHDDPDRLLSALSDVVKARGWGKVAEAAGIGRESLYKSLAPGAHPRYETVTKVVRALGMKVSIMSEPNHLAEGA